MTTQEMFTAITQCLDDSKIKYECSTDGDQHYISTIFKIKCKLDSINILFSIAETGINIIAVCPFNANSSVMDSTMKYITMANLGLRTGNFDIDTTNGKILFRTFIYAHSLSELSSETIAYHLSATVYTIDHYGDGLAAVLMGFSDPVTEIKKADAK